jgi:hypothetical protein
VNLLLFWPSFPIRSTQIDRSPDRAAVDVEGFTPPKSPVKPLNETSASALGNAAVPLRALRGPHDPAKRSPAADAVYQGRDLELTIQKLRQGTFLPSLLERRRRIDYVHGVSTRKVDDLVSALGVERHFQVRDEQDVSPAGR